MKKNEMVAGERYWIAPLNDWKATGEGEEAIYTGRSDGLRAVFQFASSGPDDDGVDVRPFVHVRATYRDAEDILIHVWDERELRIEQASKNTKRVRTLDVAPDVHTSLVNGMVTMSQEAFDKLTVLARKGQQSNG